MKIIILLLIALLPLACGSDREYVERRNKEAAEYLNSLAEVLMADYRGQADLEACRAGLDSAINYSYANHGQRRMFNFATIDSFQTEERILREEYNMYFVPTSLDPAFVHCYNRKILQFYRIDYDRQIKYRADSLNRLGLGDREATMVGGFDQANRFIYSKLDLSEIKPTNQAYPFILVSFQVDTTGALRNITLNKGYEEKYNQALIEIVKSMPKWIPKQYKGEKMATEWTMKISLDPNEKSKYL